MNQTCWDKYPQFFIDAFDEWEQHGITKHWKTAKAIANETPKSILEVGSGTGVLYKAFLKVGFFGKYLGIDQTIAFVKYCSDMYGDGLFKYGKAHEVYIPGQFDICIAQDILRHNPISMRYKILDNIVPHVKKKLILAEPLAEKETEEYVQTELVKGDLKIPLEYYNGSLELVKLIDYINAIKHVEEFTTMPRDAFPGDAMDNQFIIIKFGDEKDDSKKK